MQEKMVNEIIIYVVLFTFLLAGLWTRAKLSKFSDYALGSAGLSKLALSATVVATLVGGGSTIGSVSMVHKVGIIFVIMSLAWPIGYVLIALYLIPKIEKYYGHVSLPDIMGAMYGKYVKEYTGVIAYVFLLGAFSMQLKALSVLFFNILGYESNLAPLVAVIIIVVYSSLKGVTGVIRTDIIQLGVFIIILPIITISILKENTGSLSGLLTSLPKDSLVKDISLFTIIALTIQNLIPDDAPDLVHRILIGRDNTKNRAAILLVALVSIVVILMILIIASIALIKYPDIDSNRSIFIVIKNFLDNNISYSFFGVALIAIIVSTADSILNTASVIIVNDIINAKEKSVLFAKVSCFATGVIAMFLAYKAETILGILIFFGQLYTSAIAAPFFLGLYTERKKAQMFWVSSVLGVSSYLLLCALFPKIEDGVFLFSIILSVIGYLTAGSENFSSNIKGLISSHKENSEIKMPIKNLGYYIAPITLYLLCSNQILYNSQFIGLSILIFNLLVIVFDVLCDSKSRVKQIFEHWVFWYCFPVYSLYLYLAEVDLILFVFIFSCTILLSSVFYKWEKVQIKLITAYIFAFFLFLFVNQFNFQILVEKVDMLSYMMMFVILVPYYFIRPAEERIETVIDNKIKRVNTQNENKLEQVKGYYFIKHNMFPKYYKSFLKYLNSRDITPYLDINQELSAIEFSELILDLDNYLSYTFHDKIDYCLQFVSKDFKDKVYIKLNEKVLYLLLFNIGNFIYNLKPEKVNLSIQNKEQSIELKFNLESLFMSIKELEMYSDIDSKSEFMNIQEVKKIVERFINVELCIGNKTVLFKIIKNNACDPIVWH